MELIKRIYLNATNGHRYEEVTKGIWFAFARYKYAMSRLFWKVWNVDKFENIGSVIVLCF